MTRRPGVRGERARGGAAAPVAAPHEGMPLRQRLGFRDGERGTHSGRTLMLRELARLFEATSPGATLADYRRAVVADNVLGKATAANRLRTWHHLRPLYGLDETLPVFRALRTLWPHDPAARPLLALLCAYARDPLLRLASPVVVEARPGEPVAVSAVEQLLDETAPDRFSPITRRAVANHVLSTFTQSGHLCGHRHKRRARVEARPASTAYALFLAYLEGRRAVRLLEAPQVRLLDATPAEAAALARQAARAGWLDYLAAGAVVEIRFPGLLTPREEAWLRG